MLLASFVALAVSLALQDPATDRLIERLGDPDPEAREAAEAGLRKAGAAAVEALRRAAEDADGERAARAKVLLEEIDFHQRGRILAAGIDLKKNAEIFLLDPDRGEPKSLFRIPSVDHDPPPARVHMTWVPGRLRILVFSEHHARRGGLWHRGWVVAVPHGRFQAIPEPADEKGVYTSSPAAVSPDGSRFAVAMNEARLDLVSLDGLNRRPLKTPAGNPFSSAWSADGKRLVFGLATAGRSTVVYDVERQEVERVWPEKLSFLAFAPAGDAVVGIVESKDRRTLDLIRLDLPTLKASRLLADVGWDRPALAPDGRRIAVARTRTEDLVLVAADGTGEEVVAKGEHPTWSPDGSRLAYHRDDRIFILDLKTRTERNLGEGTSPVWGR